MAAVGTSSCIRLRVRRKVDFPQPDGPMIDVTLPAGMSMSTPATMQCFPNQAVTPSARSVPPPEVKPFGSVARTAASMRTSAVGMSVIRDPFFRGRLS